MILRILLALLVGLIAVPAAAAPACQEHVAVSAAMPAMHHAMPAKHDPGAMPADQACIGCVAPSTARAPWLAAPIYAPAAALLPTAMTGAPIGQGPPATPPPRSEG